MPKHVAILGGGVAGLSAAHELVERGFKVTVYEKCRQLGGKARSNYKHRTGFDGRRNLPTEHGFRFFPGFYKHLPDTMKRIPCPNRQNGVFDNLVPARRLRIARPGRSPIVAPAHFPQSLGDLLATLRAAFQINTSVPPLELLHFVRQLLVMATSCNERRFGTFESVAWWDFIGAGNRSAAYQQLFATGLSRCLVACRAEEISARTGGSILLQLIWDLARPGFQVDRLLNGPTSEVWIRPWVAYLKARGVLFCSRASVVELSSERCEGTARVTGVVVMGNDRWDKPSGSRQTISADYYILAVPVEVADHLLSDDLRNADPRLQNLNKLETSWMNGIQFYLDQDVPITAGHVLYISSPWALTSISQQQFWRNDISQNYGKGNVGGILSVDVSNWKAPGKFYKKPADDCTREEIVEEVWKELKLHLNVDGQVLLSDANRVDYQLDRDICFHTARGGSHDVNCINREPLLINTVGSWWWRPEAVTSISNLFLAADYVRTNTDLATMEGANEAARRAVNGILLKDGSSASPCDVWPMDEPFFLRPFRALDRWAFNSGRPNVFQLTEATKIMDTIGDAFSALSNFKS